MQLPDYAKPDLWLDDNNAVEFKCWKDEPEPYMGFWWHSPGPQGARHEYCFGSFPWRKPDEHLSDGALWTLNSLEPLDVSPSLLCLTCGAHGFIKQGRWVPA